MKRISVTNECARAHTIPGVGVLSPGLNFVDADAWKKAKEIKSIQIHIAAGDLTEGRSIESAAPAAEVPADALSKMNVRDAAAHVSETLDVETLRAWALNEKRPAVKKAIQIQIDTVDAAGKE